MSTYASGTGVSVALGAIEMDKYKAVELIRLHRAARAAGTVSLAR